MKRGISLLLAAIIIAGCNYAPRVKNLNELKTLSEAAPEKIIDGINRNGTEIPVSKFAFILPYGESSLIFLDKKEKQMFITDADMKVVKEYDLKRKLDSLYSVLDWKKKTRDYYAANKKSKNYDSLYFSTIENAFITGDTLILANGMENLNKLVLTSGEIKNLPIIKSVVASPYNLYVNREGNYCLTHFGVEGPYPDPKYIARPAHDKESVEKLKKMMSAKGENGIIVGAEITPNGKIVNQFRLGNRDYGHNLPMSDNAYYAETEEGYCIYFSASKNIIFYNNDGDETGREEFPVADNWGPPAAIDREQRQIKMSIVNPQGLTLAGINFLQRAPGNQSKEGAVLVKYNSKLEPLGKILLKGTAETWGYKNFKWGKYLVLYPEYSIDDKMYLFRAENF